LLLQELKKFSRFLLWDEIFYFEGRPINQDFREDSSRKEVANFTSYSAILDSCEGQPLLVEMCKIQ